VADTGNHAIRRIALDGTVTTYAGRLGVAGAVDGNADQARFHEPTELRIGPDGTLYVLDARNNSIRRIDDKRRVTTLGGVTAARCATPCAAGCGHLYTALTVDPAGRVWTTGHGHEIHLLPPDQPPRRVLGSATSRGFRPDMASESLPIVTAIAFDGRGNLLVGNGPTLLRVNAAALERRVAAMTASTEPKREPRCGERSGDN
jgi:sugar lactone lactonase YvrE